MSSLLRLLTICVLFLIIFGANAAPGTGRSCPAPSRVYGCKPVCRDHYDCKGGKLCCDNACGTKSCAEPAHGAANNDKYTAGGPGTYCGNMKCSPWEKCVFENGKYICRKK